VRVSSKHVPEHAPTTFEHRAAAASLLWAAAPPPLVHATGFRRTFLGVSIAGGHAVAPTRALQLRYPPRIVACCTRSSSPSPRTDVPGCHRVASHGVGHHVRARSSSSCRVLPRLLRVPPPPRLYRLRAWPLLAITIPTAYTVVFVHYDFTASVIASSSTKSTPTIADGFDPSSLLCVSQPLWSLVS
jgi:hypothetical protein